MPTRIVYEVTVKGFDNDRMAEAYEAARAFDQINACQTPEILVLCRDQDFPEDATDGVGLLFGSVDYQDISFRFVDIYGWISGRLLSMTPEARLSFYRRLNEYISEPNTVISAKKVWASLHDDQV